MHESKTLARDQNASAAKAEADEILSNLRELTAAAMIVSGKAEGQAQRIAFLVGRLQERATR